MGNVWEKLNCGYRNKEMKILTIGLDAAGKTSVLYKIKLGEVVTTIPTIGFNVETLNHKGSNFVIWDFGGRDKSRPLLKHYYQDTRAVILVVDSNDRERISECKDELWRVLKADELRDAIILVMANKQDLPNAMTVNEVSEKLEIQTITDRYIYVQGTCAHSGSGLYEGLDWIKEALTQQKLQKSATKPEKELIPEEKAKYHSWWTTVSHYFMPSQAQV